MSRTSVRPERTGIMLAHPATERRVSQLGNRFFIQPKLNGERCWVEWFNRETPMLISSYGNEFNLPHITAALIQQNLQGIRLDGELYIHGEPFETIHSIASASRKELHPRSEEMQFHIFDFKMPRPQHERLIYLYNRSFRPPLHFVETKLHLEGSWENHLPQYIDAGYEGIILRGYSFEYTEKRTPFLLKFKPTEKDHYRILDVVEGEGWCQGMLGSFIVTGDDNTRFSVGSGKLLTKANRKHLWEIRHTLTGKLLEVKHERLTTNTGIPKCAVALAVIDPKGETSPFDLS